MISVRAKSSVNYVIMNLLSFTSMNCDPIRGRLKEKTLD
jgi:hypothetical protein